MKKILFIACSLLFFYSCRNETITCESTVISLSDTTDMSKAEKDLFANFNWESARLVKVILSKNADTTTAAITKKDLNLKPFPFLAVFHSDDGFIGSFCGCNIPYVEIDE